MANITGSAGEEWTAIYLIPFNGLIKLISGSPKAIGCIGTTLPLPGDPGFSIDREGTDIVILTGEALYLRSYTGTVEVMLVPFNQGGMPADYFYSAALGRVPGVSTGFTVGQNTNLGSSSFEIIGDQGGKYTYLTENTQLYLSSTSPLDTNVSVLIQGLDDDYNPVLLGGTSNGQAQSPLNSSNSFRVFAMFVVGGTSLVGELYLSELGDLTNGVPDDATKIKAKIPLSVDTNGAITGTGTEFASENSTHLGLITSPAGIVMPLIKIIAGAGKDDNIIVSGRLRVQGGVWLSRNPVHVYQTSAEILFDPPIVLPEKTDLEFTAIGGSPGSTSHVQAFYTMEKMP